MITVFQSDKLKAAQDAVTLFDRLVIGMLILTVLLAAATILLAPTQATGHHRTGARHRRGSRPGQRRHQRPQEPGRRPGQGRHGHTAAVKTTVNELVSRLQLITHVLLAIGLAVAIVAFLTGGSRWARRIRRRSALMARAVSGKVDADGLPAPVRWARGHVAELRWAALVLAVLALFFVVSGWVGLLVTLVVLGLFEAAVTYVATRELPGRPA